MTRLSSLGRPEERCFFFSGLVLVRKGAGRGETIWNPLVWWLRILGSSIVYVVLFWNVLVKGKLQQLHWLQMLFGVVWWICFSSVVSLYLGLLATCLSFQKASDEPLFPGGGWNGRTAKKRRGWKDECFCCRWEVLFFMPIFRKVTRHTTLRLPNTLFLEVWLDPNNTPIKHRKNLRRYDWKTRVLSIAPYKWP